MRNGLRSWALAWSLVGVAGWALLPWYAIADGIFSTGWPTRILTDRDLASAALQAMVFERPWLLGPGLVLLAALIVVLRGGTRAALGARLMALAGVGFLYTVAQGFFLGQPAVGAGATLTVTGLLLLFSTGLAARGFFRGDAFVAGAVVLVTVLVALFTFYPVARILASAALAADGAPSARAFADRLFAAKIWRLDSLRGGGCGVGWNTLALALLTAASTTALGLAFALVVTRTRSDGEPGSVPSARYTGRQWRCCGCR